MINIFRTFFFIGLVGFLFIACEEEERGPLFRDDIPPASVKDIEVENIPGGAKITYSVPKDEDVLYVEAFYQLDNGKEVVSKSSVFKNTIIIEGLREKRSQEVELVSVDRSNNRSVPVFASITPETAPIDKLFESFELFEDFGGVRLSYNNEDEIAAEILLYAADSLGNMVYEQSVFISDNNSSHYTFRSFPPEARNFGVSAIDRWDNATEVVQKMITPLEEYELNTEKFRDIFLDGDEPDAFGWTKPNLWNGSIDGSGFHTAQGEPGTVIPPYTRGYHVMSMDLGVVAKLSRFKFWQRQGSWIYTHGNPRYFEIWGIDEIPDDDGASLEGWTKLVENGEVVKPSGSALGNNSAEDEAAAASGEEFDFPIEAPPVRYIRFVNLENWSGGKFMHFMEIKFWGQEIE